MIPRWVFDVPGNGPRPCFMLDPHIIPQKWGDNLWTNPTDLQSSLMGLNKRGAKSSKRDLCRHRFPCRILRADVSALKNVRTPLISMNPTSKIIKKNDFVNN
jgi:hypothetical protein